MHILEKHGTMQRADKMNIIFTCTGNTCRSPIAEGLFKKKTKKFFDNIIVSSCGLSTMPGDTASENAIKVMSERGVDLTLHRSRQINHFIIDEADYIICLAQSHYNALYPIVGSKAVLLGKGIPDPYMGDENVYRACADSIEQEIDNLLASDLFAEITEMTEDDILFVSEIENANFSEPWSIDAFLSQIKKDYSVCYVVKYLSKVIGYICCDDILNEVYIGTVAVDINFRRRNVGLLLINKIIDYCKNHNAQLLTLEVRESNTPAINLYLKSGFEILGKRKSFYSKPVEDALIMTKYFNGDENENFSN